MSYDLQNFYKTTLLLDWTIGTGNFYVTTLPTISTGWLVISPNNSTLREIVKYSATGTDGTGNYITVITRGVGGTSEQTHSAGEPIRMNITAEYWASMQDDIDSIVAAGASNANTTTRGIVEEATAAEIDAGTQTGSTGAELFINPKLLNDAHNIPLVVPSTSGNLMTSNGTDWTSAAPAAVMPVFQQLLPTTTGSVINKTLTGSNSDGSVVVMWFSETVMRRYTRDTNTGMYYCTHEINPTVSLNNCGNLVVIGSYIYTVHASANVLASTRFLLADLTGETNMTVPAVADTGTPIGWTDGTAYYVICGSAATTSRKWSVSGTTFTAVSTATSVSGLSNNYYSTFYDGTSVYVVNINLDGTTTIKKLDDIMATSVTTTTYTYTLGGNFSSNIVSNSHIAFNIGTNRMYIGKGYEIFNATTTYTVHIPLIPITKP